MKKIFLAFTSLMLVFSTAMPLGASAVNNNVTESILDRLDPVGDVYHQDPYNNSRNELMYRVLGVVRIALSFVGLLVIILIIFGGFKWMTARGNDKQVEDAQAIIKRALIGMIVIASSYFITVLTANIFRDFLS